MYTIVGLSNYRAVNCFSLIFLFAQVFLEPVKEIQQMGHLQYVDVNKIFCNLEELCEVMENRLSRTLLFNPVMITSSEKTARISSYSVLLNKNRHMLYAVTRLTCHATFSPKC